jgi:hypothetical protein
MGWPSEAIPSITAEGDRATFPVFAGRILGWIWMARSLLTMLATSPGTIPGEPEAIWGRV